MPKSERDIHPRQITSKEQVSQRDNCTPVSRAEIEIRNFDGFNYLQNSQQEALTHYAGTIAYYFGLRIHSRVFPNVEDRIMINSAAPSKEEIINEQEQLRQSGIPESFSKAADLIGHTIALDMLAERVEQAMQNIQDLYRRKTA